MLQFPTWKYVLAAIVIALSAFYSLPNLYPQDPAVQIAANRGSAIDDSLTLRVRGALEAARIEPKSVAVEGENLVVRTATPELQTQVSDLLRAELGQNYTVALNLASTVPDWLTVMGANAMSMGLDLQGGVHFLLEVDQQAAIDKRTNGFADEISAILRDGKYAYTSVSRTAEGIQVLLRDGADMDRVRAAIGRDAPELELLVDEAQPERLLARVTPAQIKAIIAGEGTEARVEASAFDQLEQLVAHRAGADGPPVMVASLLDRYPYAAEDARTLAKIGILDIIDTEQGEALSITCAQLVRLWGDMRKAGFDQQLDYTPDILGFYTEAADFVGRWEATTFMERVEGHINVEKAATMVEHALPLMLDFFGLLRQRSFFRHVEAIRAGEETDRPAQGIRSSSGQP